MEIIENSMTYGGLYSNRSIVQPVEVFGVFGDSYLACPICKEAIRVPIKREKKDNIIRCVRCGSFIRL